MIRLLLVAALVAAAAAWWLSAGRSPGATVQEAVGSAARQAAQDSLAWMREEGAQLAVRSAEQAAERVKRELGELAARPEAGALVASRLIEALVTDAPSPDYVDAVARVFDDNGRGERGDMRAVVHAMLVHPQAQDAARRAGSLKEPLLRAAAALLAQPAASGAASGPAAVTGPATAAPAAGAAPTEPARAAPAAAPTLPAAPALPATPAVPAAPAR